VVIYGELDVVAGGKNHRFCTFMLGVCVGVKSRLLPLGQNVVDYA